MLNPLRANSPRPPQVGRLLHHKLLLFCIGLSFFAYAVTPRPATDRPNLIIVLLDDAGYGDFSITGHPTIKTLGLARLACEGMRFSQFYCAAAACSASRYSLLTGRNARRSGLGSLQPHLNSAGVRNASRRPCEYGSR